MNALPQPDLQNLDLAALAQMASEAFSIQWNTATKKEWDQVLYQCPHSTITQTWQYAMARAQTSGRASDMGLIFFHGKPVGLVMVEIKRVTKWFRIARIDRGPIWIYPEIPPRMLQLVMQQLRDRYRLRHGYHLTFYPELPKTKKLRKIMFQSRFSRWYPGYQSFWVDLLDPKPMKKNLSTRWQRSLKKAEKANLAMTHHHDGAALDLFLTHYEKDKTQKKYHGTSQSLLRSLFALHPRMFHIALAYQEKEVVAGVLILRHGLAATYQAGWNLARGRESGAHHGLLWDAAQKLRAAGVKHLDLGGFNNRLNPGLYEFKKGMGGQKFELIGGYY